MSIKDTLTEIEGKMAEKLAQIDEIRARTAPIDAEIGALVEQEQALQVQIREATVRRNAARGDPEAFISLKREYGVLASTRMQLRQASPLLEAEEREDLVLGAPG